MRPKLGLFLLLCASLALLAAVPASHVAAARAAVDIRGFAYRPTTLTINVGDTVSWTNNDSAPHTVTFDTLPIDSGDLGQGQVFSRTFTAPGTFRYHCEIHPTMRATLSVIEPVFGSRLWLPLLSR